jgi:hypothetical protein
MDSENRPRDLLCQSTVGSGQTRSRAKPDISRLVLHLFDAGERPVPNFADLMSDHIYFAGDPAQDSARRHLERVLRQPQPRRWPLLAAIFAGGTAFTLWRVRQNRRKKANDEGPGPTSPEPRRTP